MVDRGTARQRIPCRRGSAVELQRAQLRIASNEIAAGVREGAAAAVQKNMAQDRILDRRCRIREPHGSQTTCAGEIGQRGIGQNQTVDAFEIERGHIADERVGIAGDRAIYNRNRVSRSDIAGVIVRVQSGPAVMCRVLADRAVDERQSG